MKIEGIIRLNQIVDKLAFKHQVETFEVEEALDGKSKFRFVEKATGKMKMFIWLSGQTEAGRYLTILFIYKQTKEALILSARKMANKERKMYDRK
jgi:uncharacterized DUF497 family protein